MYVSCYVVDSALCFPGLPYVFKPIDKTVAEMVSNYNSEVNAAYQPVANILKNKFQAKISRSSWLSLKMINFNGTLTQYLYFVIPPGSMRPALRKKNQNTFIIFNTQIF